MFANLSNLPYSICTTVTRVVVNASYAMCFVFCTFSNVPKDALI